jgi:hypothetical protein
LLGQGAANFGDSVANADDGGLTARIEEATAALIDDPAAFAADREWILLAEISREERGV